MGQAPILQNTHMVQVSTLDNRVVLLTTYVEAAFFYEVKFFGQKEGAHLRSIYVVTLMTSRST